MVSLQILLRHNGDGESNGFPETTTPIQESNRSQGETDSSKDDINSPPSQSKTSL